MAALDDLSNAASRLEAAANVLGAAATAASTVVKAHTDNQAAIGQHVSRLNAVATAITNASAALNNAIKG